MVWVFLDLDISRFLLKLSFLQYYLLIRILIILVMTKVFQIRFQILMFKFMQFISLQSVAVASRGKYNQIGKYNT